MDIHVVLQSLPPREVLAQWWRELEARSVPTFFTSWSWIGCWLDILPFHLQPHLLIARDGDVLIGLGLVIKGKALLLRTIPVSCWRLHSTGLDEFDNLVIEYNGFLAEESRAVSIQDAMLSFLLTRTGVGRFEITKAEARFAELASKHQQRGMLVRTTDLVSYIVNLDEVRRRQEDYLSLLSPNTRSQIRRSLRGYRALGDITLTEATSVSEATSFLDALRALHAQKWAGRGEVSAFAHSEVAQRFHEGIIAEAFARGEIQLLRIAVGAVELGYLYNFVHRGRVVFYQAGFRQGLLDKQDRPGLVCHALAIEHNVRLGRNIYDFTAGDYRYKASLAPEREPQGEHVFQHDGVLPRLEEVLRTGKQWLQNTRSRVVKEVVSLLVLLNGSDIDLDSLINVVGLV